MKLIIILGAAVVLSACSAAPAPHRHPAASPVTAPGTSSPPVTAAAAACSKLRASPLPLAAYDQLVVTEVTRIAGGGHASAAVVRAARATVAAEIRVSCPQFSYLAAQEAG